MLNALIFDLDGTLLDSMHAWQDQLHQFLLDQGITPPADLINITKTLGTAQAIAYVIDQFHLPLDPDEAYDTFLAKMGRRYAEDLALKPYVQPFLDRAKEAGLALSIATATPQPLVQSALNRLALSAYFDHVLTVEEVGVGKHDPAIFLASAARLGHAPSQCAVFEDSLQALKTARAAGFRTVAVDESTALLEKDEILQTAHRYIYSFAELL